MNITPPLLLKQDEKHIGREACRYDPASCSRVSANFGARVASGWCTAWATQPTCGWRRYSLYWFGSITARCILLAPWSDACSTCWFLSGSQRRFPIRTFSLWTLTKSPWRRWHRITDAGPGPTGCSANLSPASKNSNPRPSFSTFCSAPRMSYAPTAMPTLTGPSPKVGTPSSPCCGLGRPTAH